MFTLGFFCLFIGFVLFIMFMLAIGSLPSKEKDEKSPPQEVTTKPPVADKGDTP